ncbi:hypothetical protein EDD15DRAFT_990133 [Pisolithus albus]|nr:hypothetical protein EDD15DRAFT_990133 [Pisolithus albus]
MAALSSNTSIWPRKFQYSHTTNAHTSGSYRLSVFVAGLLLSTSCTPVPGSNPSLQWLAQLINLVSSTDSLRSRSQTWPGIFSACGWTCAVQTRDNTYRVQLKPYSDSRSTISPMPMLTVSVLPVSSSGYHVVRAFSQLDAHLDNHLGVV